jgi:hypothetical protein
MAAPEAVPRYAVENTVPEFETIEPRTILETT